MPAPTKGSPWAWVKAIVIVAPMLASTLLLGLPDAQQANGWWLAAWIGGGLVVLADAVYLAVRQRNLDVRLQAERARDEEQRALIEDDRTRRRVHALLREFHTNVLGEGDDSLRITVFLRNGHAGADTHFVPIVRYRATDRVNHLPQSQAKFTDAGSRNIRAVVREPLHLVTCAVETQGMDRARAEAWFITNLDVEPAAVKLLSDDTLFRTQSLGDVGLAFGQPKEGHTVFGWISFASFKPLAFEINTWTPEKQDALAQIVRQVTYQLAPVLDATSARR